MKVLSRIFWLHCESNFVYGSRVAGESDGVAEAVTAGVGVGADAFGVLLLVTREKPNTNRAIVKSALTEILNSFEFKLERKPLSVAFSSRQRRGIGI